MAGRRTQFPRLLRGAFFSMELSEIHETSNSSVSVRKEKPSTARKFVLPSSSSFFS